VKKKKITVYKHPKAAPELKLDLGAGKHCKEGFDGVDRVKLDGIKYVHDLKKTPWPWKDSSVDEVHCSHFLEHLTGEERIPFMAELWRVLKPGAKAVIVVPDYRSVRAIQDPTHKFPPIGPQSFMYWNAEWRNAQGNDIHYIENGHPINFDFSWAESYDPVWGNRAQDARVFGANHYNNVVQDIIVTMVKKQEAAAG
jgi:SAM-dependent methyltransferase